MTEQWCPVPEFEEFYEVSDLGRVRSFPRAVQRRHGLAVLPGRVLRPWANNHGYLLVHLISNEQRRRLLVHRLVLSAFVGPCPEGMEACHGDGDHANNRLGNLRWDTSSANTADVVQHGRFWQLNRTACPLGHHYLPGNLCLGSLRRGNRICLACKQAKSVVYRAQRAGKPHASLAEISAEKYARIARAHSLPPQLLNS